MAKSDNMTCNPNNSATTQVILAGISNSIAASVTNPVDVIKIRLQMHGEGVRHSSTSIRNTFLHIFHTEGSRGLYRGLSASICREMSYSGISMGLYEPTKHFVGKIFYSNPHDKSLSLKIISGATTGCIGSTLANPFDLAKCRMQSADGSGGRNRIASLYQALKNMKNEGGIRKGLWRGTSATVQRATLLNACQVPSYDHAKHYILDKGYITEGYLCHFLCSMFAGVIAAFVTSPVDLVKSRVMIQKVDAVTGKGELYSVRKIYCKNLIRLFESLT